VFAAALNDFLARGLFELDCNLRAAQAGGDGDGDGDGDGEAGRRKEKRPAGARNSNFLLPVDRSAWGEAALGVEVKAVELREFVQLLLRGNAAALDAFAYDARDDPPPPAVLFCAHEWRELLAYLARCASAASATPRPWAPLFRTAQALRSSVGLCLSHCTELGLRALLVG
jgi:hypothetical protein